MSPLHYRHGCIIVRGGKVIGKGFNDYRSGYNGGALSTGQSGSVSAVNGSAIRALTKKSKNSNNQPSRTQLANIQGSSKPTKMYNAFANCTVGTGGGCLANTPLSMHSEMMAINSALSLSSTIGCQGSARTTQWLQKPCFKLSSRSKRQARLQRLKAYADAVCGEQTTETFAASERRGVSQVQQSRFEPCPDLLCGGLQGGQTQRGAAAGGGGAAGAVSEKEHSRRFRGVPENRGFAVSRGSSERETPEAVSVRHATDQSRSSPPAPPPSPQGSHTQPSPSTT